MKRKSAYFAFILSVCMTNVIGHFSARFGSMYDENSITRSKAAVQSRGHGFAKAMANKTGAYTSAAAEEGTKAKTLFTRISSLKGFKGAEINKGHRKRGQKSRFKACKKTVVYNESGGKGNAIVDNSATGEGGKARAKGDQSSYARSKFKESGRKRLKGAGWGKKRRGNLRVKRWQLKRNRLRRKWLGKKKNKCIRPRRRKWVLAKRRKYLNRRKRQWLKKRRRKCNNRKKKWLRKACSKPINVAKPRPCSSLGRLLCETCRKKNKHRHRRYVKRWRIRNCPCYRRYWDRRMRYRREDCGCKRKNCRERPRKRDYGCKRRSYRRRMKRYRRRMRRGRFRKRRCCNRNRRCRYRKRRCRWRRRWGRRNRYKCKWKRRRQRMRCRNRRRSQGKSSGEEQKPYIVGSAHDER